MVDEVVTRHAGALSLGMALPFSLRGALAPDGRQLSDRDTSARGSELLPLCLPVLLATPTGGCSQGPCPEGGGRNEASAVPRDRSEGYRLKTRQPNNEVQTKVLERKRWPVPCLSFVVFCFDERTREGCEATGAEGRPQLLTSALTCQGLKATGVIGPRPYLHQSTRHPLRRLTSTQARKP